MSWNYRKFPLHQVACEDYKIIGRITVNYMVYTKLVNYACNIQLITSVCQSCISQLEK